MSFPVICIGASLVDELFFCSERPVTGTSNPAKMIRSAGGVVSNIARHLACLDVPVQLMTVLGNDPDGEWIFHDCMTNKVGMEAVLKVHENTGKYVSIQDEDGKLFVAACADPCTKFLTPAYLQKYADTLASAVMIILDCNVEEETIQWLSEFAKAKNIPLLVEPVSVAKAGKLSQTDISGIYLLTPNEEELPSLCNHYFENTDQYVQQLLERGVKNIWLRRGEKGSLFFTKDRRVEVPVPSICVTDSTGAGDAALAGWVAARYYDMNDLDCIRAGHALALEVLQVKGAHLPGMTKEKLFSSLKKYYPDET